MSFASDKPKTAALIESHPYLNWYLALWAGGVSFSFYSFLRSYIAASKLVKKGNPSSSLPLQLRGNLKVLVSGSIASPATAGIFRPAVLVPVSSSTWTYEEWQIVLEHEIEHILRRHPFTKLLAGVCCVLYWFHPLVWWAARRHSRESERVCDERVLSRGIDNVTYAAILVRFAENRHKDLERGVDWMGHPSALTWRVSAVLESAPKKLSPLQKIGVISLFSLAVVVSLTIEPGWSGNPKPAIRATFASLPQPNSSEDPYRYPESELVINEYPAAPLSNPVLNDARDLTLYRVLRSLSLRTPRSPEDYVAKRARWAMAQAKDGELVRPLLKTLEDSDWKIRAYAAYVLGAGRIPEAVPALIRNMDEPIWRMRAMAAFALAEIGDPEATDALRKSLSDPAWQVRVVAVPFFVAHPEHRSAIEQLQNDPHPLVRDAAIKTLGSMEN